MNNAITAITGKDGALTKIQDKLTKALDGDATNKGILARLDDLEDIQDAINSFLEKNRDSMPISRQC